VNKMLLEGDIDNQNNPWLKVIVIGSKQLTIHALIDTGFTGELLLPKEIATALALKQSGVASCKYADGSEKT